MNRQLEISPGTIGGQDLGWFASEREREAATIPEREIPTACNGPHRASQLRVLLEDWLNAHPGRSEQLPHSSDVDVSVDQLADDLRKVRSAERCRIERCSDKVSSGLAVHESQHGRGIQYGHSAEAAKRRSASNSSTSDRAFGTIDASSRSSARASCGRSSTRR